MRRKSTFLAIAAAAATTAAHAQGNVTIYGVLDVGVSHVTPDNGTGSLWRLDTGVGPGSRLGFRGTEDLGDGLRANFVLEMGIGPDTGAIQQGGLPFGRQAWVGLSSVRGWSFSAGRQYSPVNIAIATADTLGQTYWGNLQVTGNGLYQSPGSGTSDGGFQATGRVNNSLAGTLTTGPVTWRGMFALGDERDSGAGRLYAGSATYSSGNLTVVGAFTRFRQYFRDIPADADPAWQSEWLIGGSYDFGVAKVHVGHYVFDPSEENKTLAATTLERTQSSWLGAKAPAFGGTLLAQAVVTRFEYPTAPTGRGTSLALAYEYPLSKRTLLYVSGARVRNNDTGAMVIFGGTSTLNIPAVLGADPRVVTVGMRHVF